MPTKLKTNPYIRRKQSKREHNMTKQLLNESFTLTRINRKLFCNEYKHTTFRYFLSLKSLERGEHR